MRIEITAGGSVTVGQHGVAITLSARSSMAHADYPLTLTRSEAEALRGAISEALAKVRVAEARSPNAVDLPAR
jgi:hypothetical protein